MGLTHGECCRSLPIHCLWNLCDEATIACPPPAKQPAKFVHVKFRARTCRRAHADRLCDTAKLKNVQLLLLLHGTKTNQWHWLTNEWRVCYTLQSATTFNIEESIILAVFDFPILYDTSRSDYRDTHKKAAVWKLFGARVNLSGKFSPL